MSRSWLHKSLSTLMFLFALALSLGTFVREARAQDKAMVLHAVNSGQTAWVNFVKDRIKDTNLFAQIDDQGIGLSNPDPMKLLPYKLVVVIASSYGISDGDATGDALNTYMSMNGKGAVLLFLPYTWQTGSSIQPPVGGAFKQNWSLFSQVPIGNVALTATQMGMTKPGDPLIAGVQNFTCGSDCRRVTGLMPVAGTTVSAYYADMTPLAAWGSRRVDLNMWAADDSVLMNSWNQAGRALVQNAVIYLSSPILRDPAAVTFSPSPLGLASSPRTVKFKNISANAVQISSLGIDGANSTSFSLRALVQPGAGRPVVVQPGAEYAVDVTYKPTSVGMHSASLYINAVGFGRISVGLSGESKGNLLVIGAPVDFGGVPLGSMAQVKPITLRNVGASSILLNAAPTIGNTMQYTLTPDLMGVTYPLTLTPGASYSFKITYNPGMTAGKFDTEVRVDSTDVLNPLLIPVTGMAGTPKLDLALGSPVILSDTAVNTKSLPLDVLMTNSGNSDLDIADIKSDSADFEVIKPASLKIKARDASVFQIVFAPKMEGQRRGKITLTSNDPMGARVIDLVGTGTTPQFSVSVNELDFGNVIINQPAQPLTFDITNNGNGVLSVTSITIQQGMFSNSFSVGNGGNGLQVMPMSKETITVNCTPKSAGMLSAVLRVQTNLMAMGMKDITLKAQASGAVADVSPKLLEFGDAKVMGAALKKVTIANSGNEALKIKGITLTNEAPMMSTAFGLKATPMTVAAGMSATFDVEFKPPMAGDYGAKITIDFDDTINPRFIIQVTGKGVLGNLSVSPMTLDFGGVYVGQRSEPKAVKLKNIGTTVVDMIDISTPAGDNTGSFRQSMMMPIKTALMPGEETDVYYVFEPRVPSETLGAKVIIKAEGLMAPIEVQLRGSALSPVLDVKPSSHNFGTVNVGEESAEQTFKLTNGGADKLAIDVGMVDGEAAADFVANIEAVNNTLEAGMSTDLVVKFKPAKVGNKRAQVVVKVKGTEIELATITFSGQAVPGVKVDMGGGCSVTPRGSAAAPLLGAALLLLLGLLRRRRTL